MLIKLKFKAILHIVNGKWGEWNRDGECSSTCDQGWQKWRRECNAPKPKGSGILCSGKDNKTTICNIKNCTGMNNEYDL